MFEAYIKPVEEDAVGWIIACLLMAVPLSVIMPVVALIMLPIKMVAALAFPYLHSVRWYRLPSLFSGTWIVATASENSFTFGSNHKTTITTSSPHGFEPGDLFTITGLDVTKWQTRI